ncbi:hypothetical protein PAMA_008692 [Pampus argenteus]
MTSTLTHNMTTMMNTSSSSPSLKQVDRYYNALLVTYSVVLLIGSVSLSFMMHIMKSSITSITSIAVLNLIFTHFIFLLTVPFRIYYYATYNWNLGLAWCKVVSGMIHIHMYMSFIFYVLILVTRMMTFYWKTERLAYSQKVYALIGSVVLWMVVLVLVPCIISLSYGNHTDESHSLVNNSSAEQRCFNFGYSIESAAKVVNYIISTLIIVVVIVLTALQANVLQVLYRKHHQGCTSQQDFGAHLKSMCIALIMVICFIPYHIFRLYYLEHLELENFNELFLSLTTFNCLDMLTFLQKRTCAMCYPGKAI